ncbi:MAG: hypothetical protein ACRC8Y_20460 [Chroococcales cyanobacterium]
MTLATQAQLQFGLQDPGISKQQPGVGIDIKGIHREFTGENELQCIGDDVMVSGYGGPQTSQRAIALG